MAKNKDRAVIFPKEKNSNVNPISINYKEGSEVKVTNFFRKLLINEQNKENPRQFKQIIYLYVDDNLKYLKPFELI